jgi:hypothetical protein
MLKRTWLFALLILVIGTSFARLHIKDHANLLSAEQIKKWQLAAPDISKLHSGDLIFRHGRGFISEALLGFNQKEKKYSHAGIVTIENGVAYVYHAIGGEENETNKLRKDLLSTFCNPSAASSFAIYRPNLTDKVRETIVSIADNYFKSRLEFDTTLDLKSDDKMYCTEFVYKVFLNVDAHYFSHSSFSGKDYIACDDLYLNPNCFLIYSYSY